MSEENPNIDPRFEFIGCYGTLECPCGFKIYIDSPAAISDEKDLCPNCGRGFRVKLSLLVEEAK